MMRLDSIGLPLCQVDEAPENLQACASGLLRMELHAEHVVALDDGRELVAAVPAGRHGSVSNRRGVRVREINARSGRHVDPRWQGSVERIPPDVWHLDGLGIFVAAQATARA